MSALYLAFAFALFLTWLLGLVRVVLGPAATDSMLATQFLGTIGVATVLLLSFALNQPVVVDVALVLALLSLIATGTFVRRLELPMTRREG